jgi:N-carbamoylputrescine amidase
MATRHNLHIGASWLESTGQDFFNTFTLMTPDGSPAGRVRKHSLPGFEAWFFRPGRGPVVIPTTLGRIAVGICHDNSTAQFMRTLAQEDPDLLLMPHSAPTINLGPLPLVGQRELQTLRNLPAFYAQAFGIPVIMSNKAAAQDSTSPIPWLPLFRLHFHFVGQSTITDAQGNALSQLDEQQGIAIADVTLTPEQIRHPAPPKAYWSDTAPFLPRFPRTAAALFQMLECTGKIAYTVGCASAHHRMTHRSNTPYPQMKN